jgi:hypothetical protein
MQPTLEELVPEAIQRRLVAFGLMADANHIKECIAQGKDLSPNDQQPPLLHEEDFSEFPDAIASCRGALDYLQMT